MARQYGLRPDKCDCFGGYCYKAIGCRTKIGGFETVRSARMTRTSEQKKQLRPILAWREDGSHNNGPIPLGRIPEDYLYLFED